MDVYTATKLLGGKMYGNEGRSICPVCQKPKHKNPSLTISQGRNGKTLVHCHKGCDYKEIWDFLQGYSPSQVGRFTQYVENSPLVIQHIKHEVIESKAQFVTNSYAVAEYNKGLSDLSALSSYLSGRGIELFNKPDIRFSEKCRAPDQTFHPALITPMRKFGSDAVQSIHRTYLEPTSDGQYTKRQDGINKAMLGSTSGCHAMISEGREPSKWMIVAEGIENAFAINNMKEDPFFNDLVNWYDGDNLKYATILAATSAANLANMELPKLYDAHFTEIYIWCDQDKAGREAGDKLADRAMKMGYEVVIHGQMDGSYDANDELIRAKKKWNEACLKQGGKVIYNV